MTSAEYIQELVEDVISAAVDFGRDPSTESEEALMATSDSLYKALEIFPNVCNLRDFTRLFVERPMARNRATTGGRRNRFH